MATSYSGDPANSDSDQVRFLCGDVGGSEAGESDEFFLSDSEVQFAIDNNGSLKAAALACAQAIVKRLSREADSSAGDASVDLSQRREAFAETVQELEQEVSLGNITPLAGGISRSDKESFEEDTDRVSPFFTREGFDSPRADDRQGKRSAHDHQ